MRTAALLALLVCASLAGCQGKPGTGTNFTGSLAPGVGDLEGRVTDDEFRPIAGVQVDLRGPVEEASTTTDETGAFAFGSLVASTYVLTALHPRFEPSKQFVAIENDTVATVDVSLKLLPENRPFSTILTPMRGHYDCAAEAVILTGDCFILWENVTGGPNPVTVHDETFSFNVSKGWTTALMQVEYSTGPNNQLDGMRFYVAPANESDVASAHHTKLAIAEGDANPLLIRLDVGQPHERADAWKPGGMNAQLDPAGGRLLGLVYPRGNGAETTETVCDPRYPDRCFLGVGLGLSIDFTARVAIFYNGAPVPDDFKFTP